MREMVQPRQVIFPISVFQPWRHASANQDAIFSAKIAELTRLSGGLVLLGRARTGIYLLVKHTISSSRRKVILSPYTIPDVVNMVRFAGGEPVFVDCLPQSTNIDMDHLATLMDNETCCILLTHYHVNQQNTFDIVKICRERDIYVFDDCAISLGASMYGKPNGSFTDGSIFSFSGFKIMNFFWGGMISVNAKLILESIVDETSKWPRLSSRQYARHAWTITKFSVATSRLVFPILFQVRRFFIQHGTTQDIFPFTRVESKELDQTILTRPSLTAVSEWTEKLKSIEFILSHRRMVARVYDEVLHDIAVSRETNEEIRTTSSFMNYPIFVGSANRDRLYREVMARGFDIGLSLYPNAHETTSFTGIAGASENVSTLVRSILTLPTHWRIDPGYARKLATCVRRLIKQS